MKGHRNFLFIIISLVSLFSLISCGSGGSGGGSSGTSVSGGGNVRLNIAWPSGAGSAQEQSMRQAVELSIPGSVQKLILKVKASDMSSIIESLSGSQTSVTVTVPYGADRNFIVIAYQDAQKATPSYYGSTVATITGDTSLTIEMSSSFPQPCGECGDIQAPSIPVGLSASVVSSSEIKLTWQAATDDKGVAGYKIWRDGAYTTSVTTLYYTDTGLTLNTPYTYQVAAYDAVENVSQKSLEVSPMITPWVGTKLLGTPVYDGGFGATVDSSGNVYITGYTYGNLDGNTNAGGSDIFLAKYDFSGTKWWTRLLGTPSDDIGQGVAVDSSGNVYITGYTYGNLDGNTNAGGADIFLAKYDSSSNKQWTQLLGTPSDDIGQGVAVDSSGNVYITGYTYGNLDGNTKAGGKDVFLAKYDSSGTKQWTRLLGTPSDEAGVGVAVDSSGNVYVSGGTYGNLDGNTNAGSLDIFLAKYDSSGNKQWTRLLGTASDDLGWGVAVDSSGNVYITGYTGGNLDGNINAGDYDIFLAKYDSSGNKQWSRLLGTPNYEYGQGVAVDGSGNVYITGYTYGNLDGNTNAGGADIFLAKYDSSGTKQWTGLLGTPSDDFGRGVAVDDSGNVYITGYTLGNLDGNTNAGDYDIFLAKYDWNGVKQ